MNLTAKDLKDFLNDDVVWPSDSWYEDLGIRLKDGTILDDDLDIYGLPDSLRLTILSGAILSSSTESTSFIKALKRWMKERSTVNLVLTVDKVNEDALREMIATSKINVKIS